MSGIFYRHDPSVTDPVESEKSFWVGQFPTGSAYLGPFFNRFIRHKSHRTVTGEAQK